MGVKQLNNFFLKNLTIEFIATAFNKYNNLYFDGSLKTPKFEVMNTKRMLGQFCYDCCNNFTIRISKFYDRTEREIEQTIIHEMIHEYIRQNKIIDTNRHHGRVFYSWCDKINALGGWNLERATDTSHCSVSNENKSDKVYNVCIYKQICSGKYVKIVINDKYVEYFKDWFSHDKRQIGEYVFFKSNDCNLAPLPSCRRNACGICVSEEEFLREYNFINKVAV